MNNVGGMTVQGNSVFGFRGETAFHHSRTFTIFRIFRMIHFEKSVPYCGDIYITILESFANPK